MAPELSTVPVRHPHRSIVTNARDGRLQGTTAVRFSGLSGGLSSFADVHFLALEWQLAVAVRPFVPYASRARDGYGALSARLPTAV
jgi:hypothetical protein